MMNSEGALNLKEMSHSCEIIGGTEWCILEPNDGKHRPHGLHEMGFGEFSKLLASEFQFPNEQPDGMKMGEPPSIRKD